MKTALLILTSSLFASSVHAFAPPTSTSTTTSINVADSKFEKELGATRPLGFFDPMNLMLDADKAEFDRLRYVELKHGRVSMLAVVGYLVQEAGWRLPGNIDTHGTSFASIRNGFAAFNDMPSGGVIQLLAFVGFLEVFVMKDVNGTGDFVGDFRNDGAFDLGWDTFDEKN